MSLNGIFKTKQTIGGLHCYLYFDWDNNAKLKEVTLRTKGKSLDAYGGTLRNNWSELIKLLTILHGDALQGAPYPNSADLQDGLILDPTFGELRTNIPSSLARDRIAISIPWWFALPTNASRLIPPVNFDDLPSE